MAAAQETVFSDVSSSHPHFEAIQALSEAGILSGYPDHSFRPDQPVNRAEALKIILLGSKVFVPEIQPQEVFTDVTGDVWYGKFVAKAKGLGVVSGDAGTGRFRPGDTLNLAEALKILSKTNTLGEPDVGENPFPDVPADAWFAPYFEAARRGSWVDADADGNVNPALPMNRGSLAELIFRFEKNPVILADGKASYYAGTFHGKTTASGEVYDASQMTAAHRTLPFGSHVRVTNTENGQSVVVRINDRGPYGQQGRIIDLSKAAFEAIAPLSRGVIDVKVEPADASELSARSAPAPVAADLLAAADTACSAASVGLKFIAATAFEGFTLDRELPSQAILDELVTVSGKVTGQAATVSAFINDASKKQTSFSAPVSDGRFTLAIRFPRVGTYQLGLIPGESGESVLQSIEARPAGCLKETEAAEKSAPSGLALAYLPGGARVSWNKGDYNLFLISFVQGEKRVRYITSGTSLEPVYRDFLGFKEGDTQVFVRGATLLSKSLAEQKEMPWSAAATASFKAATHYEAEEDASAVTDVDMPPFLNDRKTFTVRFKALRPLRSQAAVILPGGGVKEAALQSATHSPLKNKQDVEIFAPSDTPLSFSFTPAVGGLHVVEVNDAEGLAVLNRPLYLSGTYPLLPNPADLSDRKPTALGNVNLQRNRWLGLINRDRKTAGLSALTLDASLSDLAQLRADDMAANDYFGHWDAKGRSANDLRKNFAIKETVAENLAKDVSVELAHYGLMQSAIHRANLMSTDWTRVGLGLSTAKDGGLLFVQIFSSAPLDLSDLPTLRNRTLEAVNSGRAGAIVLTDSLSSLAQAWSDRMVKEDFFDFTSPDGDNLVDSARAAGVKASLGTYIAGNTSFTDALAELTKNEALKEAAWRLLGVGLAQDSFGIIKITLLYTE